MQAIGMQSLSIVVVHVSTSAHVRRLCGNSEMCRSILCSAYGANILPTYEQFLSPSFYLWSVYGQGWHVGKEASAESLLVVIGAWIKMGCREWT